MSDINVQVLEERLEQHRVETAAHRKADMHERREMKTFFSSLNENMIHLTTAVTEWKMRDAMFEKEQQEHKAEIRALTTKQHTLELRIGTLENVTAGNTKSNDRIATFALKVFGAVIVLSVIGGLAFKLNGA